MDHLDLPAPRADRPARPLLTEEDREMLEHCRAMREQGAHQMRALSAYLDQLDDHIRILRGRGGLL